MAGFDPDRASHIFRRWRLVDVLDAYAERTVERDREDYRFEILCWIIRWANHGKPPKKTPPKPPESLSPRRRRRPKEEHRGR